MGSLQFSATPPQLWLLQRASNLCNSDVVLGGSFKRQFKVQISKFTQCFLPCLVTSVGAFGLVLYQAATVTLTVYSNRQIFA